jgi:hypothetical protein
MAGCAGSSPCSARGERERTLPGLLLRPACGGGPPCMGAARGGRHPFPARLATLRAALLAADAAECTERLQGSGIKPYLCAAHRRDCSTIAAGA